MSVILSEPVCSRRSTVVPRDDEAAPVRVSVETFEEAPDLITVVDLVEAGEPHRILGYFGVDGALDLAAALVEALAYSSEIPGDGCSPVTLTAVSEAVVARIAAGGRS